MSRMRILPGAGLFLAGGGATAADFVPHILSIGPVPIDFLLFACVLLGIAMFHRHTFTIALGGLFVVTLYKVLVTGFKAGAGVGGLAAHPAVATLAAGAASSAAHSAHSTE